MQLAYTFIKGNDRVTGCAPDSMAHRPRYLVCRAESCGRMAGGGYSLVKRDAFADASVKALKLWSFICTEALLHLKVCTTSFANPHQSRIQCNLTLVTPVKYKAFLFLLLLLLNVVSSNNPVHIATIYTVLSRY